MPASRDVNANNPSAPFATTGLAALMRPDGASAQMDADALKAMHRRWLLEVWGWPPRLADERL